MHRGIQEDQECQNLRNRFKCLSPRPLRAAHQLFRVPKATALPVLKMQKPLESPKALQMQKQLESSAMQKKKQPE
eukprot:10085251-Prorocentrum_lima.AAC.1